MRALKFPAVFALQRAARLTGRTTVLKVGALTFLRASSAILDVLGLLFLARFSTGVLGTESGQLTENPVEFVLPGTEQWGTLALLGAAVLLMSLRSFIGFLSTHKLQRVLEAANTQVITERANREISRSLDDHEQSTSQEIHHALTAMTRGAVGGVLGPISTLTAEGSLVLLLLLTLAATSPLATLLSLSFLGLVTVVLYRLVARRQLLLGQARGRLMVKSLEYFQEISRGYRELRLSGNLESEIERFTQIESSFSQNYVEQQKLHTAPRYVLESAVLLCLGLVTVASSLSSGGDESLVVVTVFAAAMARLLPSVIPVQAALSDLQTQLGIASSLNYSFSDFLESRPRQTQDILELRHPGPSDEAEEMSLEVLAVSYRYPDARDFTLEDISFCFVGPQWFAIDGDSGSGKSTLLDLILGFREPTRGRILINGVEAPEYPLRFPGQIAYLPQTVSVPNRSIWESVALGRRVEEIDFAHAQACLDAVGLGWLRSRAQLTGEELGEAGHRLSGGQLQRLGIARCLYEKPSILVLDESTSGLDERARDEIIGLIESLVDHGIMVITVSHDRSLSSRASRLVHLQSGKVS